MINRIVVGAHHGIKSWLFQRVTAFLMCLYVLVAGLRIFRMPMFDYASWVEVFYPLWFRSLTFVVFSSMCFHAWVGMRDIVMDYVKPLSLRLIFHIVVIFFLLCYMFWAFEILQGVS
ncbi:succinate dehydrogenase, hydrophobic membrane anchor protein [Candidatus Ichthyocystis sparus]|uniref:succinate dehydrogenase, hydrophobic membrane anchor protein n=1 Tax=Candidatus Ichthyocystis sparus TaxID=1561004 RepID=UPI000B8903B9|nr:succinate dehydrogenase, hydrophobic membrane anchor protein [Candidatus Ichthyocystis sparus]